MNHTHRYEYNEMFDASICECGDIWTDKKED
jgi:hypothetical protein